MRWPIHTLLVGVITVTNVTHFGNGLVRSSRYRVLARIFSGKRLMRHTFVAIAFLLSLAIPSHAEDGDFARAAELTRRADYKEAIPILQRLADAGNPYAMETLASLHLKGLAGPQDLEKAAKLYESAAQKNLVAAQRAIAQLYAQGQGVKQDASRAVYWLKIAAEKGDMYSEVNLARAYKNGDGVEQNYAEALKWFKRAAAQDAASVEFEIANLYADQNDVKDEIDWTHRAAEHGVPLAQYSLGVAYSLGHGVPINLTEAFKWVTLAAIVAGRAPGQQVLPEKAAAARENIVSQIKPSQRDKAEIEVWEWLDKFKG
jgi:uncharacterized protein